jgi:hypothetical protein
MNQVVEYRPKIKFRKKLQRKSSIQFLPQILSDFSIKEFFDFKEKKLKSAYLIDIIHTLILKYYFKKENLFHLSSIVLKDRYGYLYNYYIQYLVEKGHLILVYNYLKGKNSRVYKLSDNIIFDKINRYTNSDKVLMKKYHNMALDVDREKEVSNKICNEVKVKLIEDLNFVEIQYDKAIFFLDSTLQDIDIYNRNKYSVECIKQNQIFYHFDDFGRFHTNFTILKSFIRKNCLSIDNDETIEFDIKNSQPLFLNLIIKEESNNDILQSELDLFKFLTKDGLFYDYILLNSKIENKKLAKEFIYKVLFGKNGNSKADNMFKSLFPTIHNFIKNYKLKYKNYKVLAHKLQSLESNLIFNQIIKEIKDFNPEIRLITIHDSIVCAKKHSQIVEKIFKQKLEEEFDF